jgi:hypothetical protein
MKEGGLGPAVLLPCYPVPCYCYGYTGAGLLVKSALLSRSISLRLFRAACRPALVLSCSRTPALLVYSYTRS